MTAIKMHPSELAYAFSYSKTGAVIGWGRDPFQPTTEADGDAKDWFARGAARLLSAGRLVEKPGEGVTFTDEMTSTILALADPVVVFLAERKAGDGLRRLTVHVTKDAVIGMTHSPDGMFELIRYADIAAAATACSGFLGAAGTPIKAGPRIDTTEAALTEIHGLATAGETALASEKLVALGATEEDAASIVKAMAEPVAAGVLSILYCSGNVATNAQPFSVMTNAKDETWILFPPASLQGPRVLEQSSVPALTGRVLVSLAARLRIAA